MSRPHFEGMWGWHSQSRNGNLRSPPGLPKTHNFIAGVKTPRLEVFFIPLETFWNVDVENGLAWAIRTFAAHKLCAKEGPRVKLPIWFPTIKSRKSPRLRCVQVECDTLLEKLSRRSTRLLQTSSQSEFWVRSYKLAKFWESKSRQFQDSFLGVPRKSAIRM